MNGPVSRIVRRGVPPGVAEPADLCAAGPARASDVAVEDFDRRPRVRPRWSPAGVAGTCVRPMSAPAAYDLPLLRRMHLCRFALGEPAAHAIGPADPIGRTAVRRRWPSACQVGRHR
jgi:hypothetical protein